MGEQDKIPNFDPTSERGVHNPRMLDLIRYDQEADTVFLHMIEYRPWGQSSEQSEELQEKLNNYLDYVLDGHLVTQYPSYANKAVGVILEYSSEPSAEELQLFAAMGRYLESINWKFLTKPYQS